MIYVSTKFYNSLLLKMTWLTSYKILSKRLEYVKQMQVVQPHVMLKKSKIKSSNHKRLIS